MKYLIVFLFCALASISFSQNVSDPLFWKNRPPSLAYWQQDVSYEIKAKLDDEKESISGELELSYTNNSPDDLTELYFHVYQNMFEPDSYKNLFLNEAKDKSGEPFQHTEVSNLSVNGSKTDFIKDNTILIVQLSNPIKSGETARITCDFVTQFGEDNGRMKMYEQFGYKHFNVVHWYPRISVYDRKFGWTTDQHFGHEFYGDFGNFDVEITLPEQYVLDGTGSLLNRDEVLPKALLEKLDIKNFASKPWNEKPSEIIAPSGVNKTWIFRAKNVHDFAFTADPTYRLGLAKAKLKSGREVDCVALAQEQHASGWQNAAEYTAKIIELYSADFGEYAYPKMIVADARDGMEYPMLTLDGGRDASYRSLLAHEIGHNWFFGMVGNNETYRASLDEGFTQFLTAWSMIKLEGDTMDYNPNRKGLDKFFYQPISTRDQIVYGGYYYAAIMRADDPQLNTHSDHFKDRRQYGQVYSKTAVMLYNLEYVLGDSLFLEAMQHYFDQWKFCHPYFEDFRASIIQFTGVDLNWFFDQWLETEKKPDYGIKSFKKIEDGKYELKIERKGEMQMPIEVSLFDKEGNEQKYWIPNTYFIKQTDVTVLPKWMGWNEFNSVYTAVLETNSNIKRVHLDASDRLADVYTLDNKLPFPVDLSFDNMSYSRPSRSYQVEWRPSLWYNGFDGLKVGVEAKGGYFSRFHRFEAGVWFNTGVAQQVNSLEDKSLSNDFQRFNYQIHYSTPLRGIGQDLYFLARTKWLDGLAAQYIGWAKQLPNDKTTISQSFHSLYRANSVAINYLIYPEFWNADRWNNFSETKISHRYQYGKNSTGKVTSALRTPFLASDYDYGFLNIESVNENRYCKLNLRTRTFAQLGLGKNWAPESQLFASGGNPELMTQNAFTRSVGFVPPSLYGFGATIGNFQAGGGLNLRGYNNYLLPELNSDSVVRFANVGTSGLAINTELEFDDLLKLFSSLKSFMELKTYLFADAGVINVNRTNEKMEFSNIRADAGIGVALEIKRWGRFTDFSPTTIRADFPLLLNRPPSSQEYFQFRWLLAIDRAF
jgi:hypothetical protein